MWEGKINCQWDNMAGPGGKKAKTCGENGSYIEWYEGRCERKSLDTCYTSSGYHDGWTKPDPLCRVLHDKCVHTAQACYLHREGETCSNLVNPDSGRFCEWDDSIQWHPAGCQEGTAIPAAIWTSARQVEAEACTKISDRDTCEAQPLCVVDWNVKPDQSDRGYGERISCIPSPFRDCEGVAQADYCRDGGKKGSTKLFDGTQKKCYWKFNRCRANEPPTGAFHSYDNWHTPPPSALLDGGATSFFQKVANYNEFEDGPKGKGEEKPLFPCADADRDEARCSSTLYGRCIFEKHTRKCRESNCKDWKNAKTCNLRMMLNAGVYCKWVPGREVCREEGAVGKPLPRRCSDMSTPGYGFHPCDRSSEKFSWTQSGARCGWNVTLLMGLDYDDRGFHELPKKCVELETYTVNERQRASVKSNKPGAHLMPYHQQPGDVQEAGETEMEQASEDRFGEAEESVRKRMKALLEKCRRLSDPEECDREKACKFSVLPYNEETGGVDGEGVDEHVHDVDGGSGTDARGQNSCNKNLEWEQWSPEDR
eukprot:g9156.t1